jgi:DNA-binding transcriptional regulator YiaG
MKTVANMASSRSASARWSPSIVKSIRKRNVLSQSALAQMVGVGLNTVYLWEKGVTQPRAGVRARVLELAKANGPEVARRLKKAGLKEGMKKPGRKPGSRAKKAAKKGKRGRRK